MPAERAILVTVHLDPRFYRKSRQWPIEDEARELTELAVSSGCRVVGDVRANRHEPVAATFLGEGKLEEIAEQVKQLNAQVVIFNNELSPAQQRNIEEAVGTKTIDRTQLILDIFAQRAKSREGKVQVELAQLRYVLPRLTGKGVMLSRQAGGIGTRGPGEQKLEVDRRKIRQRITRLETELKQLGRRREATRAKRRETEVPVAALVGYTNAGKTTLLNRLTGEASTARNQLFTTLDPLARRARLPSGEWIVVTDTVGFLHHLPHGLIEAFKATLEEARDAAVLLHVLDASDPMIIEHVEAVDQVLKELDLEAKPRITVLNKQDQMSDRGVLAGFEWQYKPAVSISAKTGEGMERLHELLRGQLALQQLEIFQLRVPTNRQDLVPILYQEGQVLRQDDVDGGTELTVRLPAPMKSLVSPYLLS